MATHSEKAPAAGASQVIVTGTPVGEGAPTKEGKELAERMNTLDEIKAEGSNLAVDRLAESGLGYYDDNIANKRYIAKLDLTEKVTPIGTPAGQLRRLLWPDAESSARGALEGILVMRDDGSFYSVQQGVKSLAEVVDPATGEALLGDVKKKAKAKK
jgi:hypothetical protein